MKRRGVKFVRLDVTEAELKILEQLKSALFIDTYTQLFRTALKELYRDTFKPYLQQKEQRKKPKDIKDKEVMTTKILDGENICRKLNGEQRTEEDGTMVCHYTTYTKAGKNVITGSQKTPLQNLTAEHIDRQFKGGTKDEILMALDEQEKHEQKGLEDIGLAE